MKNCPSEFNCPVDVTIQLIGGKYKAVILWHLVESKKRFSELKRLIPKATEKMLAQQLRDLESDGLIIRTVYPVVPPKVEYSLSEFGRSIVPVLDVSEDYGFDLITLHFVCWHLIQLLLFQCGKEALHTGIIKAMSSSA